MDCEKLGKDKLKPEDKAECERFNRYTEKLAFLGPKGIAAKTMLDEIFPVFLETFTEIFDLGYGSATVYPDADGKIYSVAGDLPTTFDEWSTRFAVTAPEAPTVAEIHDRMTPGFLWQVRDLGAADGYGWGSVRDGALAAAMAERISQRVIPAGIYLAATGAMLWGPLYGSSLDALDDLGAWSAEEGPDARELRDWMRIVGAVHPSPYAKAALAYVEDTYPAAASDWGTSAETTYNGSKRGGWGFGGVVLAALGLAGAAAGALAAWRVSKGKPALPASLRHPLR